MDWIDMAQDRERRQTFVNTVMKHRIPSDVGNYSSNLGTFSFSSSIAAWNCYNYLE